MEASKEKWAQFHAQSRSYPRWPLEAMVKLVFGKYLKTPIRRPASVLDVGCGFGNNLLPFLELGIACSGVELTSTQVEGATRILKERGHSADIRVGTNTSVPFDDGSFDLLLSLNVLHYEKDETGIHGALVEYRRVMRPGGAAVIFTVGPEHTIFKNAEPLGENRYRIANYDFRDGEQYFYFSDLEDLKVYVSATFDLSEYARVTERYPTMDLDFLAAIAHKE